HVPSPFPGRRVHLTGRRATLSIAKLSRTGNTEWLWVAARSLASAQTQRAAYACSDGRRMHLPPAMVRGRLSQETARTQKGWVLANAQGALIGLAMSATRNPFPAAVQAAATCCRSWRAADTRAALTSSR